MRRNHVTICLPYEHKRNSIDTPCTVCLSALLPRSITKLGLWFLSAHLGLQDQNLPWSPHFWTSFSPYHPYAVKHGILTSLRFKPTHSHTRDAFSNSGSLPEGFATALLTLYGTPRLILRHTVTNVLPPTSNVLKSSWQSEAKYKPFCPLQPGCNFPSFSLTYPLLKYLSGFSKYQALF